MSDIRRALVLGSNSFSGSHLVAKLLLEGIPVVGMSRSAEPDLPFAPYRQLDSDSAALFRFVRCDLNTQSDRVEQVVSEFRPTHVFNFAAQSMVAESWESPADWYSTNVLALVRLADILATHVGLERYVHVTTPEVYGSSETWIEENWSFAPSTPYAASRAAGDWHLRLLAASGRLPVVFTRSANVYGPGQQLYRIIPRSLFFARTGGRLPLHGGGTSRRSFIHIRDVVDATLRVAERGEIGECYHVSTSRVTSIRETVDLAARVAGTDVTRLIEEAPERPGKDSAYLLSSTRIRAELGWADSVTLEEGMMETLDWIDRNAAALRGAATEYRHRP